MARRGLEPSTPAFFNGSGRESPIPSPLVVQLLSPDGGEAGSYSCQNSQNRSLVGSLAAGYNSPT